MLEKCASERNDADIFTKALHAPLFLRHQEAIMGPQSPPTQHSKELVEGKC